MARARARARGAGGQASVELIGAIPLLLAAVALGWQLIALLGSATTATQAARDAALRVGGPQGRVVTVQRRVRVPSVLPLPGGLAVSARAAVRAP